MKKPDDLWKLLLGFPILVAIFIFITGCSMSNLNLSNLKFWQSKNQQMTALDETTVNKFMQTIRTRPGNADSHYLLATYYQERGRYREAITEYEKVLSIDPKCIKAYNGKGISHDQLGEHNEAVVSFEKAIALDDNLDYVWNNLCYSFVMQGKYDTAIETCKKALSLNQKSNRIRNNLAMAYAMAGEYDQAFREFQTAGSGDKSYAHIKLAAIYYDKAMFNHAAEQYRLVLIINPASEGARKGLEASQKLIKVAEAALEKKNLADPKGVTEEAVRNAVKVSDSKVSIQKNNDKAIEQCQVAGKLYEKSSFKEAKQHYEQAIIYNPMLVSAHRGLAAAEALARIAEVSSKENMIAASTKSKLKGGLLLNAAGTHLGIEGIEISNGNGRRYMARDMGKYLRARGFKVVRLSNANHFNHTKGSIYYQKDYRNLALEISKKIPQITKIKEIANLNLQNVKVRIVLGKDLITARQVYRN